MTHRFLVLAALASAAWCTTPAALAARNYDNCTGFIDALPATVSTQGTWCLRGDLSTGIASGTAITVATNNVTIDCNDFKLGGLAAGAGTTVVGIRADDRLNVTVRNCSIRGFRHGVRFGGAASGGHLVEGNRFDGITLIGIEVDGDGSTVRGNLVMATGGSTTSPNAWAIASGGDADVLDNTVDGVTAASGGSAFGIYTWSNQGGSIGNNRVRDVGFAGCGCTTYAIYNDGSGRILLSGNHLVGPAGTGLRCANDQGRARDNVINGFTTAFDGCADASGNDVSP